MSNRNNNANNTANDAALRAAAGTIGAASISAKIAAQNGNVPAPTPAPVPQQEIRAVPQEELDAIDEARELERLEADGGVNVDAPRPAQTVALVGNDERERTAESRHVIIPLGLDDARDALIKATIEGLAERVASKKITIEQAKIELQETIDLITLGKQDATGDELDDEELLETVYMDVYDPDVDDYVRKAVTRQDYLQIIEPVAASDPFGLSVAYEKGDEGRFDHYWGNSSDEGARAFRANGWVPVKRSLDKQHGEADGAVVMGDLILLRRPKDLREKYDAQLRARQEAMTGGVESELDKVKGAKGFVDGYKVDHAEQRKTEARVAELRAEKAEQDKAKSKGKTQFYFERNPLHDNKVRAAKAALTA